MRFSNFVPTSVMRTTMRLSAPRILSPSVPVRRQRYLLNVIGRLAVYPRDTTIERTTLGGRPCERIVVAGADQRRAVLYLHGGAYIVGGAGTHRALAAHLAAGLRCRGTPARLPTGARGAVPGGRGGHPGRLPGIAGRPPDQSPSRATPRAAASLSC
jgi:hypothetical protein